MSVLLRPSEEVSPRVRNITLKMSAVAAGRAREEGLTAQSLQRPE